MDKINNVVLIIVKIKNLVPLFLILLLTVSCANNKGMRAIDNFPTQEKSIVIFKSDIELSEMTVGGQLIPKANWTNQAKLNLDNAIINRMSSIRANFKKLSSDDKSDVDEEEIQLLKTLSAMGMTVLIHNYIPNNSLPTKEDNFSWSMGKSVKYLKNKYKADYGLLFYVRDQFTSSARQATKLLAALLGVGMTAAIQEAYAGIVDLETGEMVWFNHLLKTTGDTRTTEGANEMIAELMKDMPK